MPTPARSESLRRLAAKLAATPRGDWPALLREHQRRRWADGDRVAVDDYLELVPGLGDTPDLLRELVTSEIVLRREAGETPDLGDYTRRFPALAGDLTDSPHGQPELPPFAAPATLSGSSAGEPTPTPAVFDERSFLAPPPPGRKAVEALLEPAQGPGEIGRLGDYRVLRVLGEGGMGVVFEAEELTLDGRRVALKVMQPRVADSPQALQRFLREAKAAAAVEHERIVPVYRVGTVNGVPFLAMPLLKGETLEDRLVRQQRLPIPVAVRLAREAAEGLAAAHAKNVIHRDVKPGNLWLRASGLEEDADEPGHVVILDFGLARPVGVTGLTASGMILGTPAYMSPEQAAGGQLDARADLFSLGCVLYRMLTGRTPFAGPNLMAILQSLAVDAPTPPRALNPLVPAALSDLVVRLLSKLPAARPTSAREVIEALRRVEAALPPPEDRKPRPRRWGRWAGVGVLCAAAAVVAAVLTGFPRGGPPKPDPNPTPVVEEPELPRGPAKFALLVGINRYEYIDQRLKSAESDVLALRDVLEDGGFGETPGGAGGVVVLTTNEKEITGDRPPTARNIRAALEALLKKAREGDTVLVAFSGNAAQPGDDGNEVLFWPYDVRLEDKDSYLSLAGVYRMLEECRATHKFMLVDAGRRPRGFPAGGPAGEQFKPGRTAALFACSAGEDALEFRGNGGVLKNVVIPGLRSDAAVPLHDEISATDLFRYMSARFPALFLADRSQLMPLHGRQPPKPALILDDDAPPPLLLKLSDRLQVPDAAYPRGLRAIQKQDYPHARELFTRAIRLRPYFTDAYYQRGLALMGLKLYEPALADFEAVLLDNPENAAAAARWDELHRRKAESERESGKVVPKD